MPTLSALPSVATSLLVACAIAAVGCDSSTPTQPTTATSAAAASAAVSAAPSGSAPRPDIEPAAPVPVEKVQKAVNPKGEKPYEGPTGVLTGKVRIKGDEPIPTTYTFGAGCDKAKADYGKLFRVGEGGALADALVAVTGYEGYVPERAPAERIELAGCALSRNTVALTFGQRIDVFNVDEKLTYMPYLDGAPFRAVMVAVPKGDPVKLYPDRPGRYLLRDQLKRPYLHANVFVMKFATHDITKTDGTYRIEGIPVGKVHVNALLPSIRKTADAELEIKEGDNTLDLEISYDAEKDKPQDIPAPIWGTRERPDEPAQN